MDHEPLTEEMRTNIEIQLAQIVAVTGAALQNIIQIASREMVDAIKAEMKKRDAGVDHCD